MARCATCNADGGCIHVPASIALSNEVEHHSGVNAPERREEPPVQIYVPGNRTDFSRPSSGARSNQIREVYGPPGPAGPEGKTGAAGAPGRDADPQVVVSLAESRMRSWLDTNLDTKLADAVKKYIQSLGDLHGSAGKNSDVPGPVGAPGRPAKIALGVVRAGEDAQVVLRESNGEQILDFTLPRGERGEPSRVPGPAGKNGESIVGPEGKPGSAARIAIGQVRSGDSASASIRFENGTHFLDLILPRGEKGIGERGPVGTAGRPGSIDAAVSEARETVQQEFAAFKKEILDLIGRNK